MNRTVKRSEPGQRYDLLDISRFLCAFWVMAYHYIHTYALQQQGYGVGTVLEAISKYGYMGVDFFFVISGFVIAFSSEGKSAAGFFESRFFRIWPTFFMCASITALVVHCAGVRDVTLIDYLVNMTIVPAYLGVQPFDGVYWTLAYEIFFYAVVFLLIVCKVNAYRKYLMTIGSVVLIALAAKFLNEASYLALFIIGIGFQTLTEEDRERSIAWVAIAAMSVLAILGAHERAVNLGFDGPTASAIMIGLIVLFGMLTLSDRAKRNIRGARAIGLITYPLYLLHSKIGQTVFDAISMDAIWPGVIALMMVFMVALSYAISKLDLRYVQGTLRTKYRALVTS